MFSVSKSIAQQVFLLALLGSSIPMSVNAYIEYLQHSESLREETIASLNANLFALAAATQEPLWTFSPENVVPTLNDLKKNPSIKFINIYQEDGTLFANIGEKAECTLISKEVIRQEKKIGNIELCYTLDSLQSILRTELQNEMLRGVVLSFLCSFFVFLFMRRGIIYRINQIKEDIKILENPNIQLPAFKHEDELDILRQAYRNSSTKLSNALKTLEIKNIEQEKIIQERSALIVESAKMSSLGEMAGGIAHEINNPLAIISGKIAFLGKKIESLGIRSEEIDSEIFKITQTVGRVVRIIKALKQFSRTNQNEEHKVERVSHIVEETLTLCSEKFKANGVELKIDIPEGLQVKGNIIQLSQVFLNLLNNSYDAVEALSEKWIHIEAGVDGEKIIIRITDSGKIAPESIRKNVMVPFFTTKPVGKGTGLGLPISKGIVESHGGTIYLNTSSDRTQFVIELPLVIEKESLN